MACFWGAFPDKNVSDPSLNDVCWINTTCSYSKNNVKMYYENYRGKISLKSTPNIFQNTKKEKLLAKNIEQN